MNLIFLFLLFTKNWKSFEENLIKLAFLFPTLTKQNRHLYLLSYILRLIVGNVTKFCINKYWYCWWWVSKSWYFKWKQKNFIASNYFFYFWTSRCFIIRFFYFSCIFLLIKKIYNLKNLIITFLFAKKILIIFSHHSPLHNLNVLSVWIRPFVDSDWIHHWPNPKLRYMKRAHYHPNPDRWRQ